MIDHDHPHDHPQSKTPGEISCEDVLKHLVDYLHGEVEEAKFADASNPFIKKKGKAVRS